MSTSADDRFESAVRHVMKKTGKSQEGALTWVVKHAEAIRKVTAVTRKGTNAAITWLLRTFRDVDFTMSNLDAALAKWERDHSPSVANPRTGPSPGPTPGGPAMKF